MSRSSLRLVSADDEWSPLQAVIVGRAEHSMFPAEPPHMIAATMPPESFREFVPANPFPADIVVKAQVELDNLASLLQREGIRVYRPKEVEWRKYGGYTGAMPRDGLMSVGHTLIEAPFAWGCRRNEIRLAYSDILDELSRGGLGRICRAPTIVGQDTIYNGTGGDDASQSSKGHGTFHVYRHDGSNGHSIGNNNGHSSGHEWAINNSRAAFDTADFLRFGKTILGQLSNVTNRKGVEYLQAMVPEGYTVEILDVTDTHAMHIDATILPLRKGLLAYNPERVSEEQLRRHDVLRDWELHAYPYVPKKRPGPPMYMCTPWLVLNALSLDERRILVEEKDVQFASWVREEFDMEPIMCPFQHVNSLGGSFHCATVDLVRKSSS